MFIVAYSCDVRIVTTPSSPEKCFFVSLLLPISGEWILNKQYTLSYVFRTVRKSEANIQNAIPICNQNVFLRKSRGSRLHRSTLCEAFELSIQRLHRRWSFQFEFENPINKIFLIFFFKSTNFHRSNRKFSALISTF